MIFTIVRGVAKTAVKSQWLRELVKTAAASTIPILFDLAARKLFSEGEKNPGRKISKLERLKEEGTINANDFEELKRRVLESYAGS